MTQRLIPRLLIYHISSAGPSTDLAIPDQQGAKVIVSACRSRACLATAPTGNLSRRATTVLAVCAALGPKCQAPWLAWPTMPLDSANLGRLWARWAVERYQAE
ncbi:hypothetical protein ElyMa_005149000 [Elysia marginata]|uniref:CHAT domain-containing protein n=1 Tax=Elysia marginata TaxID=1093978 RepID=A0AAV4JQW8_9GAST|nr:hypothetical protein ElyMa_005149000 [Elysia marginata]